MYKVIKNYLLIILIITAFPIFSTDESFDSSNSIGLHSWSSLLDSDLFFLSDSFGLGLSDILKCKNFEAKGSVGLETIVSSNGWIYPGANIKTSLILNKVTLSLGVDYVSQFKRAETTNGSLYINQFIGYNIKNSDDIKFNIIETSEYIFDNLNIRNSYWIGEGGLSSLIFDLEINTTNNILKIKTGPQFVWQSSGLSTFFFTKVENRSFLFNSPFFVQGSATTRLAFDRSSSIFLSSQDGYFTSNEEFLSYGVPGSSIEDKKNHLIITGFETGYVNTDTVSASGFTNFIWFNLLDTFIPDVNYGVKLSTNASFKKLSERLVELIISYDTSDEEIYLGLNIKS